MEANRIIITGSYEQNKIYKLSKAILHLTHITIGSTVDHQPQLDSPWKACISQWDRSKCHEYSWWYNNMTYLIHNKKNVYWKTFTLNHTVLISLDFTSFFHLIGYIRMLFAHYPVTGHSSPAFNYSYGVSHSLAKRLTVNHCFNKSVFWFI